MGLLDAVGTSRYAYTSFGALQSEDGPWDNDTVNLSYTLKGSPISVDSHKRAKRSPAASFSFSQKLSLSCSESDGARGVVRACHFSFVRMRLLPHTGEVIRSVTHLVPAWPVRPG